MHAYPLTDTLLPTSCPSAMITVSSSLRSLLHSLPFRFLFLFSLRVTFFIGHRCRATEWCVVVPCCGWTTDNAVHPPFSVSALGFPPTDSKTLCFVSLDLRIRMGAVRGLCLHPHASVDVGGRIHARFVKTAVVAAATTATHPVTGQRRARKQDQPLLRVKRLRKREKNGISSVTTPNARFTITGESFVFLRCTHTHTLHTLVFNDARRIRVVWTFVRSPYFVHFVLLLVSFYFFLPAFVSSGQRSGRSPRPTATLAVNKEVIPSPTSVPRTACHASVHEGVGHRLLCGVCTALSISRFDITQNVFLFHSFDSSFYVCVCVCASPSRAAAALSTSFLHRLFLAELEGHERIYFVSF
jgi:hypothetical protein